MIADTSGVEFLVKFLTTMIILDVAMFCILPNTNKE